MGLIGVANGIDGDLRPGLPLQMIEVHDPLRLLMIVEQFPEIVINVIKRSNALYQWFENEWIHLVVVHPESHTLYRFKDEVFTEYQPLYHPKVIHDYNKMMMEATDNIPVFLF